jgi:hypothetical protein
VRRFWRTETVVFLGVWLVLMTVGRDRLFGDPGSLWHIVVGERILSRGELIHTDPFSYTFAGQPWPSYAWVFECVDALLHRATGLGAVLLATATIIAVLFAWLVHRAMRVGIHPLIAVLITAWALLGSSYHLHPRPHLITLMLVGWTFARLCDFESGRVSLRGLFWLVPVFVVWVNVHGGMVGGIVTVAAAVAGWGLAALLGRESPVAGWGRFLVLGGLVVACALTPLVNPFGLELPRLWFSLMSSPLLPHIIQEHVPLMESGAVGWTVLSLALLYVAALAGVPWSRLRVTWLIPLLWLVMAWTRMRHGPLFAVTATLALAEMFPHVRWVAWLARHGSVTCRIRVPEQPGPGWRAAVVPALVVATSAALQLCAVPVPVLGAGWARIPDNYWPTGLLPQLRAYQASRPPGTGVFNDMLFGGFLMYTTPDLRVFIDDRCELYGDEWLLEYRDAFFDHPERVEEWANRYGFDLALVLPDQGFDTYLRTAPGWTEVGRTENAALYRRLPVSASER